MTLDQAISYAIEHEGVDVIAEQRFVNYLNDLQALSTPAIKRVVSTMVGEGYLEKLLPFLKATDNSYEIQFVDVHSRLVKNEGFQDDLVKYVLDCLLYSLHKTGNAPIALAAPTPSSSTPSPRKKKSVKADLKVMEANGNYLIELNGVSYELDESQYKAILRKKDIPADRLTLWLAAYADERVN
ncbi:MAG: hypothetical protein NC453_12565 [Muribaculum sp.]|nr:hypothetical protein [Muribaculum sp.]